MRHSPEPHTIVKHHILPKSWGGKDTLPDGTSNLVGICGTCHDNTHRMLNALVRYKGNPPAAIKAGMQNYAIKLAQMGWARRLPDHPTPYTTSDGATPQGKHVQY